MKNLLFLFVFVTFSIAATAQITLTQSSYTSSPIGIDTLKMTDGTATFGFPSFAPALNGIWDMSIIVDSVDTILKYKVAASAPATFADSNGEFFGTNSYQANAEKAITATGLLEYGISVQDTAYEIASTVGDTFFINGQHSVYTPTTSPHVIISFPATISSSWSSAYESDFSFALTYISPPYNHAPGLVKSWYAETDTVIGWGKMRIPTITGSPSGYMDVLQVRTQIKRTDSFFLNGGITDPGLPALLGLLSFTQGQINYTYAQNFYRVNETTPLAYVTFMDSANTVPLNAVTHVQRLPRSTLSVVGKGGSTNVKMYPNPVAAGHTVSIDAPANTGEWRYELVNTIGQVVEGSQFNMNTGHAQLQLADAVLPGLYFIQITSNGKQVAAQTLLVSQRQ